MLELKEAVEAKQACPETKDRPWRVQWEVFKLVAPIFLALSVICVEIVAGRLWIEDQLSWRTAIPWFAFAIAMPFIPLLIGTSLEVLLKAAPSLVRDQKTLSLDHKGIRLTRPKHVRIRWKDVHRWFLSPVPGREGLVTVTLEFRGPRRGVQRYWSMLLTGDEQSRFLNELERLRHEGSAAVPIVELIQPMPARTRSSSGLWALAVGYFLLIHGIPLLTVGLMPDDARDSRSKLSPAKEAKLEQTFGSLIKRWKLNTPRRVQMLFWIPGAVLTSAAIGALVWGIKRQGREMAQIQRAYDLELETIMRHKPGAATIAVRDSSIPSNDSDI